MLYVFYLCLVSNHWQCHGHAFESTQTPTTAFWAFIDLNYCVKQCECLALCFWCCVWQLKCWVTLMVNSLLMCVCCFSWLVWRSWGCTGVNQIIIVLIWQFIWLWPHASFFTSGIRGNLQESEGYLGLNLIATGATVLLALYYIIWQSYVLRADVIIGAILLCLYGLTGIVGFGALARFTRLVFTWL